MIDVYYCGIGACFIFQCRIFDSVMFFQHCLEFSIGVLLYFIVEVNVCCSRVCIPRIAKEIRA